MCGTRHQIWTKFSDDWLKTATCITESVTISFKHEYRKHGLKKSCDVISDVMNINNTFYVIICDVLSISYVKMNLSQIFRNFQNGRHLGVRCVFKPEVVTEVESNIKIGDAIPYMLSCSSTF